jgi:hypothetical protein
VIPAEAHVLPPHRRPFKTLLVVVVVAMVVAAFAGGLFAGHR